MEYIPRYHWTQKNMSIVQCKSGRRPCVFSVVTEKCFRSQLKNFYGRPWLENGRKVSDRVRVRAFDGLQRTH